MDFATTAEDISYARETLPFSPDFRTSQRRRRLAGRDHQPLPNDHPPPAMHASRLNLPTNFSRAFLPDW
jgi:hypothetical protein